MKNKLNVLIVSNMYPSKGDVSWRGSFVKEQVENVKKIDPEIFFDIIHLKARVSGGNNLIYLFAPFIIFWRALIKRYDIVHCHHAFCVLVSFFLFRKIVYTVHEGELNHAKTSFAIKLAIKIAKEVIYVNKKEFELSLKVGKHFLPCGINFDEFKPITDTAIKKFILFPAEPKRLEKNAILLQQIESEIHENNDLEIIYGGDIPRENIPEIMAKAELIISIGKFESDGLVVKEAMAVNVPVISTNVGNAEYYLNEKSGCIINPTSRELFDVISKVLRSRENFTFGRARLKTLGVDSERTAIKLISIYNQFISCKEGN